MKLCRLNQENRSTKVLFTNTGVSDDLKTLAYVFVITNKYKTTTYALRFVLSVIEE